MVSRKLALVEKHGEVARVIINDPEKRNRLSQEVIGDLISAFEELRDDDSVAVVVTTGAGDVSWSAGQAGQVLLAGVEARKQGKKVSNRMGELDELVRNYPKVTIAAVNGYCLGAAITFLCCHDLAMASEENARFGLPEVLRGFPPKTILTSLFRAVPTKWAFDMVLTGENWDARTAQKAGLATRVVPHAKLPELSLQWAREIARWDRVTLEYCKKAAHAGMDEAVYTRSLALTGFFCDEHNRVNPKTHQGMRDFLAKQGVKANLDIKWV
ncbi:MAG: enoyl-CoA hydratase/isomerase family protein [Chloroflexi bacterium]|nr:enoyl-CoA hydratase/isomerase family protein [Chloroflexota bacterium]